MPQPFDQLPSSVLALSRAVRIGGGNVPALLVHPYFDRNTGKVLRPAPVLVWMHGRTVTKELDPGRYLRLARAGIATCAVDLPGHGERLDALRQAPEETLGVVAQMVGELDAVVADLDASGEHLGCKRALGGMSAGGMAALVRLTRPHTFDAAVVECTTGSWRWQQHRAMFDAARVAAMNPIDHLKIWREIPLLALHNSEDEWIPVDGQREFIEAVRARATHPEVVQFHVYGPTGAPFEHAGFGRMASDAKERVTGFLTDALSDTE